MTEWFTAAEVARLYHVGVPYVRKLAHLHRWRRRRRGTLVEYLLADVQTWNRTRRPGEGVDLCEM